MGLERCYSFDSTLGLLVLDGGGVHPDGRDAGRRAGAEGDHNDDREGAVGKDSCRNEGLR